MNFVMLLQYCTAALILNIDNINFFEVLIKHAMNESNVMLTSQLIDL